MGQLWNLFIAAIIGYLGFLVAFTHQAKPTWSYRPISVYSNSSDEKLMKADFRIDRVAKGIYAVSGTLLVNADYDDNTLVETLTYWSATNNMDFKKLSIGATKDTMDNIMKTYYKDFAMESLAKCSNLPVFTDESTVIWEKKLYEIKRCELSTEKLPTHMQPGFYKIEFVGTGSFQWYMVFIAEVQSESSYF